MSKKTAVALLFTLLTAVALGSIAKMILKHKMDNY